MDAEQLSMPAALVGGPSLVLDDTILELLPVAVHVCDAQGVIIRYNRKAAELWGRTPARGKGEYFCGAHRLFRPDGRRLVAAETPVADVLRSGDPVRDAELVIERPDGSRIWVLLNIEPIRDTTGAISGVVDCFQDITARKQAEESVRQGQESLREGERRFRELLDALPAAVYTTDAEGRITFYNRAAVELWGCAPELGRSEWCGSWRLYWPGGAPMPHDQCPMAVALREGRPIREAEAVAERPDGGRVPFAAYPTPLRDASGAVAGAVNMLVDITRRKEAERRQLLLINELNHRVKNTLATVQSIAALTFQGEEERGSLRWFDGRLMALSKAHDVLTRENWESASLREVVASSCAPLGAPDASRFRLSGPDLRVPPRMALSLAMALHELCTNAAKYGALSERGGRVGIEWRVDREDGASRLRLRWEERGGPRVAPPARRGFGSRLIGRGLAHELEAKVRLDHPPEGVVCEIDAPLA